MRCYFHTFILKFIQRLAHQMVGSERMMKTTVDSTGIYQVGECHLVNTP